MIKLYSSFLAIAFLFMVSSCSKKCVECTATNADGTTVHAPQRVCDGNFNNKIFMDRFKKNFADYNPSCYNVD